MSSEPGDAPAREYDPRILDTSIAHQARIYDYWLGGKDNYAADRKAAEDAAAAYPGVATGARANRQFLDIGTGIPAANNTHEVAQSVAPDSRVVYVDHDRCKSGCTHARAGL